MGIYAAQLSVEDLKKRIPLLISELISVLCILGDVQTDLRDLEIDDNEPDDKLRELVESFFEHKNHILGLSGEVVGILEELEECVKDPTEWEDN